MKINKFSTQIPNFFYENLLNLIIFLITLIMAWVIAEIFNADLDFHRRMKTL
jgi:hypothetical protein